MRKILIQTSRTFELENVSDIYCVSIENEVARIKLENTMISSIESLGQLEAKLSKDSFFRCHKSHLVNVSYINRIHKEGLLELQNGIQIPVARRKMNLLIDFLSQIITE